MPDLKTLDKTTIENVFTIIGIIPHYRGTPGTEAYGKDLIVVDDLLKGLDILAGNKNRKNESQ